MARVIDNRITGEEIAEAELRELVRVWFRQAGEEGGVPHRRRIDPFSIPSLSASLILFDVGEEGRLTYRIMGEAIKAAVRRNPIGLTPDELLGGGAYADFIVAQLSDCVDAGTPVYSKHDFVLEHEQVARRSARIAMPYAADGRVSRLLAYQMISEAFEPSKEPVLRIADWRLEQLAFVTGP